MNRVRKLLQKQRLKAARPPTREGRGEGKPMRSMPIGSMARSNGFAVLASQSRGKRLSKSLTLLLFPAAQGPGQKATKNQQDSARRLGNVNQVNVSEGTTAGKRPDRRQIIADKFLAQTALSHVAKAERSEAATEGGLENVVVRVVVETAAQVRGL